MPRTAEPAKPLYSLKADFYKSLDNYTSKAEMLASTVDSILKIPEARAQLKPAVAEILEKALTEFRKAAMQE